MEKLKEVMLILTESCNLACRYCFEHYKNNKRMSFAIAKKIIDYEMTLDDDTSECRFTMFGGEPLLEFDLIKQIYDYIESNIEKWNKKVIIFINTNGTLLDEEKKNWLRKRKKHIYCGLSLDGNRKMHNINRSNSFDLIDLNFYKECWPDQNVKMTVSKETLPFLAEGVIFIHEQGFECGCTFAYGINWDIESVNVLRKQLEILIDYYSKHIDLKLCQILNIDLAELLRKKEEKYKRCGAGELIKAYDTEGELYPCHSFSPVGLGEVAKKYIDYKLPAEDIMEEDRCNNCDYLLICPTCYGVNLIYTGSISKRSVGLCRLFKECVKASAIIQLKRLEKKYELNEHDYGTLLGIQKILIES